MEKSMFFGEFCITVRIFLISVLLSPLVETFFFSRMRDFSKFKLNFILCHTRESA